MTGANYSKVILVTGASSGIGKATAIRLIKEGHIVYGAARRLSKMQDLVNLGGYAIEMDVTDEHQTVEGVERILAEQGRIDVLVNNAGYSVYGSVEDVSQEDARSQFDVNFFVVAFLTQKVLPHMRKQGSGHIINITSIGGKIYAPLGAWYHGTKHALEGWSDCLRVETKPFGINVSIIQPGAIQTEFADVMNQPMLDRSKGSDYEAMANKVIQATGDAYNGSSSTNPDIIAKTISEAVKSRKSKTRYVAGKWAKPMIFTRWLTSDRMFDCAIGAMIK
jgi:short-subunit dehydrogenase